MSMHRRFSIKTEALVPLLVFALSGVLAFTLSTLIGEAPVAQAAPGPQLRVPLDDQDRPTLKILVDEGRALSPTEREKLL